MKKNPLQLRSFMVRVIESLKSDRKYPAVHTYTCTQRSFFEFLGTSDAIVNEVFTVGRLKEYQEWLLRRGKSWNTVSTYMRTLRALFNRLVYDEQIAPNPKLFDGVYTRVEAHKKRSLTKEQINKLLTTDVTAQPAAVRQTLAYFRLMFLLRGMPFIDLAHLRKQDVCGGDIVYCRHKTGKQISVHIPPEAHKLMKEVCVSDDSSAYLFPILQTESNEKHMQYKEYLRALRWFNKNLARLSSRIMPQTPLSSYTPRHTWATLAFYRGVPVGVISKALGHSSIKVTETYLRPFENETIDKANEELIGSIIKPGDEKRCSTELFCPQRNYLPSNGKIVFAKIRLFLF